MVNPDGTFTLSYTIQITNQGDVPIHNLQVEDNLVAAFPGLTLSNILTSVEDPVSTSLSINGSYNGDSDVNLLTGSDTLMVSETALIHITLTVELVDSLGPFYEHCHSHR